MRDLKNNIAVRVAVSPEVLGGSKTGNMIDLKDANRCAFVISTGAIVGAGSFTAKVQESDTTVAGEFTDVGEDFIDTDAASPLAADAAYRVGYSGYKRYIRLILTKASGTSIVVGATAVLGDLAERPVA